jgi:hypothetical protein
MTRLTERIEEREAELKRLLTQRNDDSRFRKFITIWMSFISVGITLLGLTVISWKFRRSMHPELAVNYQQPTNQV